jgi:hypothetical protein
MPTRHVLSTAALFTMLALFPSRPRAEEPRTLPPGVAPLAEDLRGQLDRLQVQAAKIRGLAFKQPVLVGQLDEPALKKQVVALFEEELPAEILTPVERAAKAFKLIPREMDLATYYPKLLTSQVGGFYEPKKKFLVLVDREGGLLGPDMAERVSPATLRRLSETVLLHELVHALQDQYYDLEKFGHQTPLSDEAAGRLALIEGDATLAMQSYLMGLALERMPGAVHSAKANADDPLRAIELMPGMPGAKELAEAPAFLRDSLLFSYNQGLVFALSVRLEGGQKLLDHAFRTDPPCSTEQILHPEKWLKTRDNPVRIEVPDLGAALTGYRMLAEGSLGEFGMRMVLSEHLGAAERDQCLRAAAGWGGDRFVLYTKEQEDVLAWVTDWDTKEDALEFEHAARRGLKDWAMTRPTEKRAVLVKGTLEPAVLATVQSSLAEVKATRMEGAAPNLAALGIGDGDRPIPAGMDELGKVLQDPAVMELMQMALGGGKGEGGEDVVGNLAKILDHPATTKLVGELLGEGGAEAIQTLMGDENVQKAIANLLAPPERKDDGKVEGQVYSNAQYGISIAVPPGEGWKTNTNPEQPPMGARAIVEFTAPQGATGKVALIVQNMPIPMDPAQMAPMVEMVLKSQFQDYQKLKGGPVTSGTVKGIEMEFTGNAGGATLHVLQRMFVSGTQMFTVLGTMEGAGWEKQGAAIQKSVESLTFGAKAEPKEEEKKE